MQTRLTASNRNFPSLWFVRFFAVYFFIYIFPFPVGYLPFTGRLYRAYHTIIDALVLWTGKYLLHLSLPVLPTNSPGTDTTYDYVRLLLFLMLALAGTLLWNIAKKKALLQTSLISWITIYVRYRLALSMITYGIIKIIKLQFPFPFYSLNETYGDSSPMRLLWSFMGYSSAYNIFVGSIEATAGFLLFFRKSALAGALLSIAVLSNVVMLNLCYDVSVKLHSIHLLFMAVFIALPYAERLIAFFFLNRAIPPENNQPTVVDKRLKTGLFIIKFTLMIYLTYSTVVKTWSMSLKSGDSAFEHTPLFGIYNVEKFIMGRDTSLRNQLSTIQWKSLTIYLPKHATAQMTNDSTTAYHFVTDTINRTVRFYELDDSTRRNILSYSLPDSDHLLFSGRLQNDSVYILMKKRSPGSYRLINRDFHWINEWKYDK